MNPFLREVPCLTYPSKRSLGKSLFLGDHYFNSRTAKGMCTSVFISARMVTMPHSLSPVTLEEVTIQDGLPEPLYT